MTKEIIAIDVDDVIADETEHVRVRVKVNSRTGSTLERSHYRIPGDHARYYEKVWEENGLNDVDYYDIHSNMSSDQSEMPLLAGAEAALPALAGSYDLVIITSRDPTWRDATATWLKGHFGNLFSEIVFTHDPEHEGIKTKGDLCVDLGATWLIDDHPGNCQSAIENGVHAILFGEYGWHQQIPREVVRCLSWKDVVEYFDGQK